MLAAHVRHERAHVVDACANAANEKSAAPRRTREVQLAAKDPVKFGQMLVVQRQLGSVRTVGRERDAGRLLERLV